MSWTNNSLMIVPYAARPGAENRIARQACYAARAWAASNKNEPSSLSRGPTNHIGRAASFAAAIECLCTPSKKIWPSLLAVNERTALTSLRAMASCSRRAPSPGYSVGLFLKHSAMPCANTGRKAKMSESVEGATARREGSAIGGKQTAKALSGVVVQSVMRVFGGENGTLILRQTPR